MFEALLWAAAALVALALILAWDSSRDILHPLFFLGPMFAFLYAWMPLKLLRIGALDAFFDRGQVTFVQGANVVGTAALLFGCLAASWGVRKARHAGRFQMSETMARRLLIGGSICGVIGSAAWVISIVNVGGFVTPSASRTRAAGTIAATSGIVRCCCFRR